MIIWAIHSEWNCFVGMVLTTVPCTTNKGLKSYSNLHLYYTDISNHRLANIRFANEFNRHLSDACDKFQSMNENGEQQSSVCGGVT